MATLTVQTISREGITPSYAACAGGGDDFPNTGQEFIHVKNGSGAPITVTIVTPATVDALAVADRTKAVAAGEEAMIGPFPTGTYNDGTGKVGLTYSGVTSLTIGVFKRGS